MASLVTAGIALVRRIQSASNMSLAGSERIDIEHGNDPGPTVSLHDMDPAVLRNRIGRRGSLSSSTNDDNVTVEVFPNRQQSIPLKDHPTRLVNWMNPERSKYSWY